MYTSYSPALLALFWLGRLIFVAGVATAALALLTTAVRTRRVSPFGGVARFVRGRVDPLFAPMERRVVRAGGNPLHAPWWTVAAVVVGGLAVHSFAGFLITEVSRAAFAAQAGPRGLVRLLVSWTFALLRLGVLVRVLGSWFQQGRWSPWTRWAYALTDWFMVPLARVIPNLGMFDISPIVAYFGLGLLQGLVLGAL